MVHTPKVICETSHTVNRFLLLYSHWSFCKLQLLAYCIAAVVFVIGNSGCAKSSGEVPVSGKLTYRGQPITNASLTFFPATGRAIPASVTQGAYATKLRPGDYTVVVTMSTELPPGFKEGDPMPKPKYVLPDEYTARPKSALQATVKPGQSEPIDFDLK